MQIKLLSFLILSFVSVAQADDFKTVTGKEYKDATASRVEPDGIVLTNKAGISKVYFTELPKDVQERFGYDPQKAGDLFSTAKCPTRSSPKAASRSPAAGSGKDRKSVV